MKEIILKENLIYLIEKNKISIVNDNEDDVEIFEYDIELLENDKVFILDDIFIIRKTELYYYDLNEEKLKIIKKFNSSIIGNYKDLFFEAEIKDNKIFVKEYNISGKTLNFLQDNIYNFSTEIKPIINEINILANTWKNKKEESKEYLVDFVINEEFIIFIEKDNLSICEKKTKLFNKINLPYVKNMYSRLILRNKFLLIDSKDFYSTIMSIDLDNLDKVNILKKGQDNINSYLSSDAKFLLAGYGDKENYPIIVNIEKNLPIVVLDLEIDASFNISANSDLSKIVISNSNILKYYTWINSKLTLEYELDL